MKTKVDENTTPETIIAEAMVGAGAPLMHSRVEEAVAGALRKAGMLVERSEQVCAWCPSSARGSAWHNDGKLHPSCGQTNHGQGWVPDYPVERIGAIEAERDAALAAVERVRAMVEEMGEAVGFDRLVHGSEAEYPVSYLRDKIEEALDGAPEPEAGQLPETGQEKRDEDGDLISSGEHRKVLHQGGYVCESCVNVLGLNVRWDHADRMEGHPLPVEGEKP